MRSLAIQRVPNSPLECVSGFDFRHGPSICCVLGSVLGFPWNTGAGGTSG